MNFVQLLQRFQSTLIVLDPVLRGGSNQLFTERCGIEGRKNICGVPLEVADHADIVRPQFDDVFGCQFELNVRQYNHQYNEMYNNVNNERNNEANVGSIHEVANEANLHPLDNVANNEEDKEPAQMESRARRVHRCSSNAVDIAGTSEGRFGGTMFVATAQYGNEQVYPIAFGYDDSENNVSWEWFFGCLKGSLGHIDDLVFISDRHASIESGISKMFPFATDDKSLQCRQI
ncbi:hypothetical protein Ddye_008483 [Dipteronia dyeriana]|uniref:MULE transposase domain-containing protein n=1 Tax=Dipteronia dyeriana TaxID=168575 RepID=A0AAD9XA20_9ROSI|nr:hypothetical protein Ddye_008483 [Dipteronia dyeriana]